MKVVVMEPVKADQLAAWMGLSWAHNWAVRSANLSVDSMDKTTVARSVHSRGREKAEMMVVLLVSMLVDKMEG